MSRRYWKFSGVVAVVLAGLTLSFGALAGRQIAEREKKVSIDQVPAAVRATILSQGGTIDEIEAETRNGQTIYEADVVVDGRKIEMKVAEDGTLLSKEDDDEKGDNEEEEEEEAGATLSIDQVPGPVQDTIRNEAKGGIIKEIEQEKEDGQVVYEAEIVVNGQKFDLKVAADTGKLLSKEADNEDEEEEPEN